MRKVLQLAIAVLSFAALGFTVDDCASTAPVVSAPCVAELSNGFTIRHQRREIVGSSLRLYLTESGYTEIPATDVVRFERDLTPAPPKTQATPLRIDEHVAGASEKTGVDEDFIRSVIRAESDSNPRAVSPKGAQGLMQLMPGTAAKLGVKDSFDPGDNVRGGSTYLRELLDRYNGDAAKALAAYNAGPKRVEQYRGVPPYRETRQYVARVIRDYNRRKMAAEKLKSAQSRKSRTELAKAKSAAANPQ